LITEDDVFLGVGAEELENGRQRKEYRGVQGGQ
jgi:hypothetical protein